MRLGRLYSVLPFLIPAGPRFCADFAGTTMQLYACYWPKDQFRAPRTLADWRKEDHYV
jgi:hypothetical protein